MGHELLAGSDGVPLRFRPKTEEWPVSHYLLGDPTFLATYVDFVREFLAGPGSVQRLNTRLDEALGVLAAEDFHEDEIEDLRDAIAERVQTLEAAIAAGVTECPVGVEGGEDECDTCIDESCGVQIESCFDDPGCECVVECIDDEEDAQECAEDCGLAEVPAGFSALLECVNETCLDACE